MTDVVHEKVEQGLERVDEVVELLESVPAIEPVVSVAAIERDDQHTPPGKHVARTWDELPQAQCGRSIDDGPEDVEQRGATVVLEDPNDRYCDECRGWLAVAVLSNYTDSDP